MDKKPWELDYSAADADNAGVKPWQQHGAAPKKGLGFVDKSMQTVGDLGISLLSGALSVPDSLVGLADATSTFLGVNNDKGNAVRKTLANDDGMVGFNPAQAKRAVDDWHSDDYKDKQQQFAQAKGVLAKTGVALSNPSLIANTVAESLPAMGAGGVAGMGARGLAAKAGVNLSARVAGAIGEGTLMAGQQAANIQEQTGGLTQGQAGAALLTGALGGGIGVMGARAAQKMGVGDIDTALVSGSAGKIAPQSVPLAAIKGAVSEGLLEELPQSVMEQLIGNIATGKPWYDNLDGAVVMGVLSGGAMGGMFGAAQGKGWGKAGDWAGRWRNQPNVAADAGVAQDSGANVAAEAAQQQANPAETGVLAAAQAQLAEQEAGLDNGSQADYATQARRFMDARLAEKRAQDALARAESQSVGSPDDEIWQSIGMNNHDVPLKPSEKMGLNPDAGAMQAAAALAVDSGASAVAPPLSAEELAEKEAREDWEDKQWYEQQLAYEQYEREQEQEAADWARDWAVAVQRGMADGYSASQASQMYDDARSQAAPQEAQTVATSAPPKKAKQQTAVEPQSEAAPPVRQPVAQALPKTQTAVAPVDDAPAGADNAAPVTAAQSEAAHETAAPVEAVRQAKPNVSATPEPLATQVETNTAPETETEAVASPVAQSAAKKAGKSKGRDAQRQLVSDWGMRVDGWAVNAEHQGAKETDNGVVGGVKDAFLNDAKAYLTAVQHELADMGFVPQLDKKGKPHKVAVNKGGTGVSGDAYLMMQRDDGTPVYVTVGTRGGSRPVVMFRAGNSSNHHPDNQMSAGSLAEMVAQYTRPVQKTPAAESKKPETVKETTDNGKQQPEARTGAVHSGTGNQSERVSELAENGTGTLESVSAENVSSVSTGGDSATQAGNRGGDDVSGSGRAGDAGHESAGSVGDGTGEVSVAATGTTDVAEPSTAESAPVANVPQAESPQNTAAAADAAGVESQAESQPVEKTSAADTEQAQQTQTDAPKEQDGAPAVAAPADFVITDADEIGQGGLKTKFKQNIEAIKTLRVIQAENDRAATPAEQKVLAKWVGWGGLAAAFRREDGSVAKGWEKEAAQLEALLSDDELRSARESTIAAHYTSPEVVKAMWAAVRQMGFQGGRVLEPAVGSGNFIGLMPQDFRQSAAVHGTELDSVTGALAQKLYPAAAVKVMGFQDYTIPDGYFKLAIGNPPFGAVKVSDKHRRHLSGLSLHNYFFAKSVDALEDNGVLAMVVTSRFMDAGVNSARARNYIAERAELLAAVRLPNNAFLKNANTQVTTDIVFLRKLPEAERGKGVGAAWNAVKPYTDKDGNSLPLNVYFHEHPEMMLGEFGAFGSMYGPNEAALVARDGQDTAALLEKALQVLPQNVFAQPQQDDVALAAAAVADIGDVKVGSVFVRDGKLWRRTPDVLGESQAEAVELPNDKARERVMGLIGIRDGLARVRRLQLTENVPDAVLDKARESLNGLYDAFVKDNGFINSEANKRLFRDDPSWAQLASLEEKYDRGISAAVSKTTGEKVRKPSAQKAAIFSRRTQYPFKAVDKVASAKDGLVESLSSVGRLDMERIVRLYGKSEADVVAELGDLVYQDPQQGWQTAEAYLSGNVKDKLAQAQLAAKENSAFARNVQALQKVQPEDIEAVDIGSSARLGAHWIPAAYLGDFLKQVMGVHRLNDEPVFNPLSNEWKLPDFEPSQSAKTAFSTERKSIREVVAAAVNSRQLNVYDETDDKKRVLNQEASDDANSKVEAVKQAWADWVWQDDERRETLSRLYNDTFNTDVPRHYDGSHLTLAGKVDDAVIALRPTQKDAVWRITQNRTTLLDHVVGAGKTFTMVAAAMELRRMGLASKPMIVVPNHLVGQWGQEFLQLYPNADILVAGKKDFEAANRKRLVARIANGDWDAVIVAHSSFGKIAVGADFEAQFIQQQIDEIERALETMRASEGRRTLSVKDLEKRRLNLEEKYKKLVAAERKDDDNLSWGELGVDALFVDEAHEFKNLAFSSTMRNVAGLGNQAGSQRAMDLYMKIQQLKQNPSSRVVFATGTPISNSMAEMYTMQRYLGEERLRRQGINHFDAWAKTFGEVVTDWELSASGKYKLKARFAKFVGLPELMQGYLAFADVINRDDINEALKAQGKTLPVPKIKGGAPENVVVPRSDFQAEYIGVPVTDEHGNETYPENSLVYRAEHLPKGVQEKGADNMLKIVGEARKLALDPRIIDPSAPDFADSKVNTAARRIVDIYRRWDGQRGTQLVFSDLSTPKAAAVKERAVLEDLARRADNGDEAAAEQLGKYSPDELDALLNGGSFSVYDDLKAKLMDAGIPGAEIAFIHDANTELQKAELFGKVRSGRVRVLIGSTSKMGAGTNVQNRLVALHHLDAPWRPSDLEQREGRIIRQGNELYTENPDGFEVEILRYATEQTMDAMQWQIIENKARFIEQVRKGDVSSRVIEDVGGEAANAAQMKAASSGNPLILEEMSLRKQVNDLEAQKLRHERNLYRVRSGIRRAQAEMENDQRRIGELEKLLKAKTPAKLDITIGKKRFTHDMEQARAEAGKALLSQVRTVAGSSATQGKTVGKYGDFSLRLVPDALVLDTVYLHLDYADTDLVLEMKRDDAAGGVLTRIRNLIENTRHELEKHQHRLEQNQASLPKMQNQLSEWDGAERLAQVREEHARVLALLKPKSGGQAQAAKPNTDNQAENEAENKSDKSSFDVADAAPVSNPTVAAYRAAIRRAVGKENMRHVRIISRERAKEILPAKHHAYIERLRGWYFKGKVVLVADNIASARVAQFTAWHELGHRGVAVSGWSDWAKALNQAYLGNPLFRQIADAVLARRADTHDKAGHDKLAAAEEALVELYAAKRTGDFSLLESRYGVKVSERFRGWQSRLMQVLARLREIAARLFGFGDSFSDGDLLRLMKRLDNAAGLEMAKAAPALDLAAPEYGQREGLFDLPPVPVTRIDADSLPKGFKDMKLLADKLLRDLQQSPVGTLHNDDMGWDLVVGKKDRKKMGNNNDLSHPTSQSVSNLRSLVKNAVLAETHRDEKHGNTDVQAVYRLYAPVEISGVLYRVKLTVKDYKFLDGSGVRKNLHAIEAVEIENAPMGTVPPNHSDQAAQPTSGRSISIADLLRGASLNNGNPFDSFDDVAFDLEIDENGFLNNPDKVSQAVNQAIRRRVRTGGVRRALGDKWTDGLKVSLQFLGRRQLTEIYRQLLPQLDRYGEWADKYSADGNRAMIRSDKLVSGWAKLKDKDALADLMHDATLAQVDADSAVKPELPADFKAWLPLRQRFNRLSPQAQAVYRQARDDYRSHFEGVQAAMEARLRRLGAKAGAVERVRQRFSEGMKGVYFPLARFGNYVVAAKNANGKVVSIGRAETMKEARTLREAYLREFPAKDGFSVGQVQLAKEYAQSRDAVGTGFLKNALDALSELNLSNEQFAGIEDTLHQLYLQSLPDLSWAKHGIHRKGMAGFSNDAMRAYARNMVHGAEYLAKLRYGDLMTAALDDMQDFSDKKRDDKDFNQPVAQRVIDEMRKRHESLLRSDVNPVAAGMTGLGFVWYLGFSPAAALVNLSQTPLVAFPMMAAKWGWLKAGQALLSASAQTGIGGGGTDLNNIRSHLNEDEQAAFDRAEADGTIDIGQIHDLIRLSSGTGSTGGRMLHKTMKVAGWMFHHAERFNRQATFVAAYRLARQSGADAEKAFEQAKDMVFRSQFDYSAENRPRVMQGNWQRVVFLFKQYSQNMIYTLARNAQLSFKGDREAQKTLAWLLAGHAMAAGVLGLPLVGELLAIASLLGGDDDEPWDAETASRLWLSETFGSTAGEVVAKGASRLTPWDISGRVGLNNLIFPDVQDGLQGRRWAESFAAGLSGPVVGLGISWADGANKIADGDWQRGLESMLPVALRNALKSVRLAREGHIDKSGVVVKDEIGWGGVLGQSVGFSPSELRLAMEGKAAVMKADRELNSRRSELLTKFARASMNGDTEKMVQKRKEIEVFNRKNPNRAITVSHLLQSVRNRRRRIAQAQDGVYLTRNRRDVLDAGSFAHDD